MAGGGGKGAGGRNVKLSIQNNPRPDDGAGGFENKPGEWVTKFQVMAAMRHMSAGEAWANRKIESRHAYKFTMDFPLGGKTVLTTDRLLIESQSRDFNVRWVLNTGQDNMTLEVVAEENVAD